MRNLILSSLVLATAFSSSVFAQSDNALNYNVVNIQAEAMRQISNDEMHAVLYIEISHKQPAQLAADITQLMNKATALA